MEIKIFFTIVLAAIALAKLVITLLNMNTNPNPANKANVELQIKDDEKEKRKFKEPVNESIDILFKHYEFSSFKGHFYQGSDYEYHYFITKWSLKNDYFKIEAGDFQIYQTYPFNTKEVWVRRLKSDRMFGNSRMLVLYAW